jgi:hypothetical protein
VYYIGGKNPNTCPHIKAQIGNKSVYCLLDSGAEISLINDELFDQLMEDGVELLTLPVSNVILASAFGAKSSSQEAGLDIIQN